MAVERHKTNPFLANMVIPVKGRQVQLSRLGKDENILINQSTGEALGTHITTFRKVDNDQFVKVFTKNIGLTFDLTAAGIKAFTVLLWSVQLKALERDQVNLDSFTLDDFVSAHEGEKLSLSIDTFKRGIRELEKSQIVAKTLRKGVYFINPNFVFNGDRIAFTTLIERSEGHNKDQGEMEI